MMNPRKQKAQRAMVSQVPEDYMRGLPGNSLALPFQSRTAQPASRKGMRNDVSLCHPHERSKASAQQESSATRNEYVALRRKFLLLEEESFNLGNELKEADDEINGLEDEKLELLDQLVVLEGLVDPSEVHNSS